MVINIRGTHGSGKSTIARKIMTRYQVSAVYTADRTRPFGYRCVAENKTPLYVPGHYETDCGGCDTIMAVEVAFASIRAKVEEGFNVLYEGILAQHSAPRVLALKDFGLTVICLDVPTELCIEAVNERRRLRGKAPLADPGSILKEAGSVKSSSKKLKAAGVDLLWLDRQQTEDKILELLGWMPPQSPSPA
jgi:hypothetical protein